jgi:plasmid stabilization system protein ParE
MPTFHVNILSRARVDVDAIYSWLSERTLVGASRWYGAFIDSANSLEYQPDRHGLAPEATVVAEPIRQCFFKTPVGRLYRILFLIVGDEVRILRVRGPGQSQVRAGEIDV